MASPLVNRLERAFQATSDPIEKAVLSAHIACYQARVGEFEEAERRRSELRKEFGDGHSARVSILIMCLDGLLLYFKNLDRNARDRLLRANLISVACRERGLMALTSAWLAHIDFNLGQYESMAREITNCHLVLDADDGTAACRVALVLGDAFSYARQLESARRWYEHARQIATRIGDQAAVGAITYNRAALHVSAARVGGLTAPCNKEDIAFANAEVRSAVNYQALAGLSSLDHLLRSASIGVMMLEGRYEDAAAAIANLVASSSGPGESAELALLHADHARCLARLGQVELARESAQRAKAIQAEKFDADDRALVLDALGQFHSALGDDVEATKFSAGTRVALEEHCETIERLASLLNTHAAGPSQRAEHTPWNL